MCGTFVFLPALNAVAGATMALRANAIGRCDLVRGWCDGLVRLGAIGDAIGGAIGCDWWCDVVRLVVRLVLHALCDCAITSLWFAH